MTVAGWPTRTSLMSASATSAFTCSTPSADIVMNPEVPVMDEELVVLLVEDDASLLVAPEDEEAPPRRPR